MSMGLALLLTGSGASAQLSDREAKLPLTLSCGAWGSPAGHLQGIVCDDQNNFLYASFTDRLVKVDMKTGEIVASVTGLLSGGIYGGGAHLGDLAFYGGKVYGSLEYKAAEKFYVAVFDTSKMTEMDMDYKTSGIMTTLYMGEVVKDYRDDLSAGGHENATSSMGHRHGCSGIDGITFGTMPGDASEKIYMMLAYGVYGNTQRHDNDYQVILAFDPDTFAPKAFDQNNPHEDGPAYVAKLFVYTGNTTYGVQNLEYDRDTGDYWLIVYEGKKDQFPNYPVYLIDGSKAPVEKTLALGEGRDYGDRKGLCLTLKEKGTYHEESGIWGVNKMPGKADTGFISLGNGFFYVAESGKTGGEQYGKVFLYKVDHNTCLFTKVQ